VNFLLDTNVISEWTKPRPNGGVVQWLSDAEEDRLFLSVVTIAELRHGVERLPAGARRARLGIWVSEAVPARFEGRVLPIEIEIATAWGRMMARARLRGRVLSIMDGFMAATAQRHDMTLVTRNVADFEALDVRLLSPWTD
jgi:toxin FitB